MNPFTIYKHLPIGIQNKLVSYQGARLEKKRYGLLFPQLFEELRCSERWTSEQILCYKEDKIAQILQYAYEHVPFYKRNFDKNGVCPTDFKHIADLQKFPILTKDDIRNNLNDLISDEFNVKKLTKYHTSGSTGTAIDFYWTDQNTKTYWAIVWRARARYGINKGECHLNFTGKLICPLEQQRPPYWRFNKTANQYMINMQHITRDKVEDIVTFINCVNFRFFTGYPSIIYSLAVLIDEMGLKIKHAPAYIFTGAEKVYENQRELIERVFKGSKIVEHYGFSEEAACASKCCLEHYHEDFELGHMELYNPITNNNGITGQLLVTGFQNLAMPFIRYKVGDTATFADYECQCGLKSQLILDIDGRNEDYILTPEGTRIMRMDYIFKDSATIKEGQVVQKEKGSIVIRIVRRDNYDTIEETKIRRIVKEMISPTIKVYFEYVSKIERTKAGKFKAVVSMLNSLNE